MHGHETGARSDQSTLPCCCVCPGPDSLHVERSPVHSETSVSAPNAAPCNNLTARDITHGDCELSVH